jgi:5-methylcytosine-specific restriction enzyme A
VAGKDDWTRAELLLALDLYLKHNGAVDDTHRDVQALSSYLRSLSLIPVQDRPQPSRFRSPSSVTSKLHNFARFDPNARSSRPRGGPLEKEIWDTYHDKPEPLRELCVSLRQALDDGTVSAEAEPEDESFVEGGIVARLHRQRERNRTLRNRKLKQAVLTDPGLHCEVCGFGFADYYGPIAEGLIEVHHVRALSDHVGPTRVRLQDLALVCSNCHWVLHRRRPWISANQLKSLLPSRRMT